MEEKKNIIDLVEIAKTLWGKKKLFLKVWVLTFLFACLYILPQPRYYTSEVRLAPETSGANAEGGLGSLASSFGFNLGGAMGADAIYPQLYPDLMSSNDFVVSLFNIPVTTIDGEDHTDYFTHQTKYNKIAFYKWPMRWLSRMMKKIFAEEKQNSDNAKVNPYRLTENQFGLVEKLKGNITCNVDKKTDVITIRVVDQDPLVAATIADSVKVRLQDFIIDYRTSKARRDVEYYEQLQREANEEYEKAILEFSTFADTHQNMSQQKVISKNEALQNEVQIKLGTCTAIAQQLQASKAKLQERMPAFTILQGASVPVKPSGPKRMVFVAAMLFLATVITSLVVCRKHFPEFI